MKDIIKDILIAVVFVFVSLQFVQATQVVGISMEPSFSEKDYLVISRQAYTHSEPERGDVVVFHSSIMDKEGEEEMLIKRVIALPGETVEIKGGKVYVDGQIIPDDYTADGLTEGDMDPLTVPAGEYFCMGDNRQHSYDSRYETVGTIPKNEIRGKVIFRLFPLGKFGRIPKVMNAS